jgi:RNA polymerase sigma factor (TIGR02999 family)
LERHQRIVELMTQLTQLLQAAQHGDAKAAEELLPIVYDDLRRLARRRLAQESPGQTLQATALVHVAYVRLVGSRDVDWNNTGHFFGAAAQAMRRIVIDHARKRAAQKRGGDLKKIELSVNFPGEQRDERLVQLDEALNALETYDSRKAAVVHVRFFAGLTNEEAAAALGIAPATAMRDWLFARAWLKDKMSQS